MREWLSGGAPPCQGGGRGFDPRLALFLFKKPYASVYSYHNMRTTLRVEKNVFPYSIFYIPSYTTQICL